MELRYPTKSKPPVVNVIYEQRLNDGGAARTITKSGNGTMTLSTAAVSLVNGTNVNITEGTLNSNLADALGSFANVSVSSGATFGIGANQTVGGLNGAGDVTLGSRTLTVGNTNNLSSTFSGSLSGSPGTLTKNGTGTFTLSGSNAYTGATTVSAGTLLINGSTAAGSAVSVSVGASIGGDGTIGGNLAMANGAFFAFDPNYTLTLNGTLTLNSSFGVADLRGLNGGAVNWAAVGNTTYILMTGALLPTFTASNISNFGMDNAFDIGGGRSAYFENGSLALVVIPEPSTWALLAFSLTAVILARRRHSRA